MYQTVNEHDFIDAFRQFDRLDTGTGGNFTIAGCRALFDHLEDFEQSIGQPIELDVIALCCDFAEYDSLEELLSEYNDDIANALQRGAVTREDVLDYFRDNTTVIEIPDSDRVIIGAF